MNTIPSRNRHRLAVAVTACFVWAAVTPCAYGAYDNVLNCNDGGAGSLRDTVSHAASGDTVVLNPVTMQCSFITLTGGAIPVAQQDLTIKYNADNSNQFTVSGDLRDRVFNHSGGGTLILQRLDIQSGKYDTGTGKRFNNAYGGCVYSNGTVDLESTSIGGCVAEHSYYQTAKGGGVFAQRGLILRNSNLTGNSAKEDATYITDGGGAFAGYVKCYSSTIRGNSITNNYGGGVFISGAAGAPSLFDQCTISGNTALRGGGISARGTGLVTIENSTISGNILIADPQQYGAGLFIDSPLTLANSTIAFNNGRCGVEFDGSKTNQYEFDSSIVANNTYTSGAYTLGCDTGSFVGANTVSGTNNLVMNAPNVTLPRDTLIDDPLLLSLGNNGGPTQTHAFRDGSPAFGQGSNPFNFTTDQRGSGYARTINGATDIGAFQQQVRDVVFASGFE